MQVFDNLNVGYTWNINPDSSNNYGVPDYLDYVNEEFLVRELNALKEVVDDNIDFEETTIGTFITELFTEGYDITYNGTTEKYKVVNDANKILIPKDTYQVFDNAISKVLKVNSQANKNTIKSVFGCMFKQLDRSAIIKILYP
jgi:ribosomal protein L23